MFMCVVHQKSVINLDLTWKQSFLIVQKCILDHHRKVKKENNQKDYFKNVVLTFSELPSVSSFCIT
jgi:hypothetical protein